MIKNFDGKLYLKTKSTFLSKIENGKKKQR